MYRATATAGFIVLVCAGSAAMAADQEHEDVQREISPLVIPFVKGGVMTSPTGALREKTPGEHPAASAHNADKAEREAVMPSWVRWPSLTDF